MEVSQHDQNLMMATVLKEIRALRGEVQQLANQHPVNNSSAVEEWAIGCLKLSKIYKGNLNTSADKIRKLCAAGYFTENEAVKIGTMNQNRWKFHVENCKSAIKRFEQLPINEQQRVLGN